jgi:carbamoyl-phosphate synthase large subunit
MPRRDDLHKILLIGSGPIVIGQACEFDYSGTQACKALREEGYEVVLVNSNPATIMTDPETADRTYIEPVNPETVEAVIERERPDAVLPTLGGQTGLNVAVTLADRGVLERYGCEMIGANREVIHRAEGREEFRTAMRAAGLDMPRSELAYSWDDARRLRDVMGLPCVIRPAFTLGGSGGGIATTPEEYEEICRRGLDLSMTTEILLEEAVLGWKEYELEVMRDRCDNVVIICSIENIDPMGIHTGDSITVAPAQTLTDREYQRMRDASLRIIRAIGVETGGSNIQFAVDPKTGRMIVIEMNPRVSRSSALASKATGFPIAKIAAKLAVGYTLDEIRNDITRETPACFEPSIDYCVVKTPRWAFEKFPGASSTLTTQMKSVGEAMSIGRTFKESFQKALRSLEIARFGFGLDGKDRFRQGVVVPDEELVARLERPSPDRIFHVGYALRAGMDPERINAITGIDPWFIDQFQQIVEREDELLEHASLADLPDDLLRVAKREGFSDIQIATAVGSDELAVRRRRSESDIRPTYKLVDTCAAEFEAFTPYFYSTYGDEDEIRVGDRPRVVILGGGPNRIGQGIEFDYCCCHAAFALRDAGYETVMVNSNPETVSTDYDTSDRLFFEPLTGEDVINLCERLDPVGVIVQFGGQTPLNLAAALLAGGIPILGTSPDSIDLAEDRERFQALITECGLRQPANGIAVNVDEAVTEANRIGYPVLVRPSYVLGGRAMEIVYDEESLRRYMAEAVEASPERPVLVDDFLEGAIEVDVDAVADGEICVVGGIMEHVEEAGIHSGDSACALPPTTLSRLVVDEIHRETLILAEALGVRGLMNVQFAVKAGEVFVLEVNPRASRTVPFVSKAIGVPLAKAAARIMVGITLREQGITGSVAPPDVSVKVPVFPFQKFPGIDLKLGPEMRSTGEVMGSHPDFGAAMAKALIGAGLDLPKPGDLIFLSVRDEDKQALCYIGQRLHALGFRLAATGGTAGALRGRDLPVERVPHLGEGHPDVIDRLRAHDVALVVNTPSGKRARLDAGPIRSTAIIHGVPCITTLSGAAAAVRGLEAIRDGRLGVVCLQERMET